MLVTWNLDRAIILIKEMFPGNFIKIRLREGIFWNFGSKRDPKNMMIFKNCLSGVYPTHGSNSFILITDYYPSIENTHTNDTWICYEASSPCSTDQETVEVVVHGAPTTIPSISAYRCVTTVTRMSHNRTPMNSKGLPSYWNRSRRIIRKRLIICFPVMMR